MKCLRPLLFTVSVSAILVTVGATKVIVQGPEGRTGTGHELQQDCAVYFSFLGRTGAGREETLNEDPFGMGYCAGIVREVANSVNAFHPEIDCRYAGPPGRPTTDRRRLRTEMFRAQTRLHRPAS